MLLRRGEKGEPDQDNKASRKAPQKDLAGSIALDQEDWPAPVVAEPQDGIASISPHQQSMIIILAQRPVQGVPQAMVAIGEEKDFPAETKPKSIDLPVLLKNARRGTGTEGV